MPLQTAFGADGTYDKYIAHLKTTGGIISSLGTYSVNDNTYNVYEYDCEAGCNTKKSLVLDITTNSRYYSISFKDVTSVDSLNTQEKILLDTIQFDQ